MTPINIFGKKLEIERYLPSLKPKPRPSGNQNGNEEDTTTDSTTILLTNCCVGFIFFLIWLAIVIIVAASIIGTYKIVQTVMEKEKVYTPFRVVNHGIWPGYRHEFFNDRVSYLKAEEICLSRQNGSVLHFNSKEQEEKFDAYALLNFWNAVDYPAFQVWTSGFVLAKLLNSTTFVIWPEPNAQKKGELDKIRECAIRGEGQINAFGMSEKFWQERHIVKDYIPINQPEISDSPSKTGCWQHMKRNDIVPESFYRFVCIRKIKR